MKTITAKFKIVTPLFLGGAEPNKQSELRAPSIKGVMRFWYRAIDPNYKKNEGIIFGSTEHGQAAFSLRLDQFIKDSQEWDPRSGKPNTYIPMDVPHPKMPKGSKEDTWMLNGIKYLSYSFHMGENERKYLPAGREFTITATIRREEPEVVKAVLTALWLLGHVGGLGSRSRRGFGTVALTELNCDGYSLPPANGEKTVADWVRKFEEGKEIIKKWFKGGLKPDHSLLNDNRKVFLFGTEFRTNTRNKTQKNKKITETYAPWEEALNVAGVCMQGFRQRWNLSDNSSDYFRVKAHLEHAYPEATPSSGLKPDFVKDAPERTAFGLPLTFRYGSLSYEDGYKKSNGEKNYRTPQTEFKGTTHERSASPIHIRIVEIAGKCHPLFIKMDAPLLPDGEEIKAKDRRNQYSNPVKQPATTILDVFWSHMKSQFSVQEVSW